jgi:hypothetical protein
MKVDLGRAIGEVTGVYESHVTTEVGADVAMVSRGDIEADVTTGVAAAASRQGWE